MLCFWTNMVCKNKLYFCLEILVPDLTHTNLFKVETWNLNLSWRTSNVLWLFYFTVQFPYSAFLVYKLSWFSSCYLNPVSYGGMFRISTKICFFIFLSHPTQDLLAANVRHSPFLAPKTPPPLTRSEFRKGWNKNWNVNILRNAFQSLETFFRNFMIT